MVFPFMFFTFTTWTTEIVTTDFSLVRPSLTIDSLGNPYIIATKQRVVSPDLFYLFLFYKVNEAWHVDTFELNACLPDWLDLTMDKCGRIWTVYPIYNSLDSTFYLIVACKSTAGWTKDTVEFSNVSFDFGWRSIITDEFSRPHIVYDHAIDTTGYQLYGHYAYLVDTTWYKEVVDTLFTYAYCCAIDLDSQNRPYVSYFRGGYCLSNAKKINNIWIIKELDASYYPSWWTTSIRINPTTDLPAITYMNPQTYQMKYAWDDGTTWHIDTIDSFGGIGTAKALDIDSFGKPYFVYNNNVAYKEGGVWHIEPLPALNPPLTYSEPGALRLDCDGTIHITRFATNNDYSYREIHYIHGTIVDIEERDRLKVEGEKIKLMVLPSVVRDNARVQYAIPEKQHISLNLYDILGRKIATISEGIFEPGVHSCRLDSSHLSSGVYFLILEGMHESKTQKLLIMR